jgi:hypothetical protein
MILTPISVTLELEGKRYCLYGGASSRIFETWSLKAVDRVMTVLCVRVSGAMSVPRHIPPF